MMAVPVINEDPESGQNEGSQVFKNLLEDAEFNLVASA